MKEFLRSSLLIISLILCFGTLLPAQFVPEKYVHNEQFSKSSVLEQKLDEEIIWYEDFAGALPAGWQSVSSNGFCAFEHTYSGPQGPFSVGMPPLNSATAANGFMILDSDLCSAQNPSGATTDAYLMAPPVDLRQHEKVMLRFQHNFRYCCTPTAVEMVVEVSTDGDNWTSFDVRNGLAPNNTSANPVSQAVNISDVAGGQEQVWIRFRKTGASHYWWMLDDVMLVSFVENDLQITSVAFNNGYTMVPAGQQQAAAFSAQVRNAGGYPQHDIKMSVTVNRLLFEGTSTSVAVMQPAQERNFTTTQSFTAPAKGLYQAEFLVSQQQQDQNPETNKKTVSFLVNDTVYSRNYSTYHAEKFITLGNSGVEAAANTFEIIEATQATSVSFALNESSQPGAELYVAIFAVEQAGLTLVAESAPYVVQAEDITAAGAQEAKLVSVAFDTPADLATGTYAVAVFALQQEFLLAAADDVVQPQGVSLVFDGSSWTPATATPFINLNLGENDVPCDPQYAYITQSTLCGNANGSIEMVPLTGIGPFVYAWADDANAEGPIRENIMAGTYSLIITDGYGCETTLDVVLEDDEISISFAVTDALCGTGGEILLEPVTGQEPFTFSWAHDAALTGPDAQNLAPDTYIITVTDVNGCEAEITVVVGNVNELPVEVAVVPAFCGSASGSIELLPRAGIQPYVFSWTGYPDATGAILDDLTPDNYSFTVSDESGCVFTGNATVASQEYALNLDAEVLEPTCGSNNGAISIAVTNGQAPFVFSWSVGGNEPTLQNLSPGTYQLIVADNYGCETLQNFTLQNTGTLPQVELLTVNSPNCGESSGSISISPVDPTAQYTYSLLGEDKIKDDGNGSDAPFFMDGLAAGQYIVSVVDNVGCERILSITVSDGGAPDITAKVDHISCYGQEDGAIAVTLVGGTAPQYLWDDENNSTTADLSGLAKGIYTLKVADGSCHGFAGFEIREPRPLRANATVNHIVCANDQAGSILLSMQGGTNPYTYIWSNGFSGRDLQNVPAGTYTVNITDYMYCTFTNTYTISGNAPLVVDADVVHATEGQNNGSVSVSVAGGVAPYTYLWSHGAQSSVLFGLQTGQYTLTVTDNVGCEFVETFTIGTVNIPQVQQKDWKLYPNPASHSVFVEMDGVCGEQPSALEIFNLTGSRVVQLSVPAGGAGAVKLDVSALPRGVYLLKLTCGDRILQKKFVKQ